LYYNNLNMLFPYLSTELRTDICLFDN